MSSSLRQTPSTLRSLKFVEMENTLRIASASISDRGLSEKRPQNEDSVLEIPQCGIYAVADGVGGAQAGEVASQMAVEMLGEAFANRQPSQDPESVMQAAITQANSAIHQMSHELPQLSNMATTIVALHLADNIATIGHVGDSRLYRVDRDGNLFSETDDHSMVADEVRAGRMTPEQAENHPGRNIINRALGADSTVEIDLKTIMVEPGTAFLLCSDGITRHVTDQEIKGVLTFGGEPADVCEYLKGLCYERGAEDNLTAVVVRVGSTANQTAGAPVAAVDVPSPEDDEVTVTTARDPFETASPFEDTDEILELEPLDMGTGSPDEHARELQDTPPDDAVEAATETMSPPRPAELPPIVPAIEPTSIDVSGRESNDKEQFSIFGSGTAASDRPTAAPTSSSLLLALGMLILGSLIGMAVYYFALAPAAPPATVSQDGQLSVMKSDDIERDSFEKLRRTVDADPAAYISNSQPNDAEDYYLIGRANMLLGDFPKARLALIEAQKRLPQVSSPSNARVLRTDIAAALTLANDPTIQPHFRQQLDAGAGAAPANANR